jgi:mannitol-1-phosphate/altronate dehydrogenase
MVDTQLHLKSILYANINSAIDAMTAKEGEMFRVVRENGYVDIIFTNGAHYRQWMVELVDDAIIQDK